MAVTETLQAVALIGQVEFLADREIQNMSGNPVGRCDALHQAGDRHHQDALTAGGQVEQAVDALRDQIRVRAELVVDKGFPVRKMQNGKSAVEGLQILFQLLCAEAVRG